MGTVFLALVHGSMDGPNWLTGGAAGPMGTLFSVAVIVAGMVMVYRVTRDYAWSYTHPPIVAGGDAVSVAPPAAHTAMEEQATKAPALVQILSTTSTSFSVGTQRMPEGGASGEGIDSPPKLRSDNEC